MKHILITGADSYIGTSFAAYLQECYPEEYTVTTLDVLDGSWRTVSFAGYDVVLHLAGLVHQKETPEKEKAYYSVNCDLAVETAKKAKAEGVGQFIFLSSMSVYGVETGVITPETRPAPVSFYGRSKWQAEQKLRELEDTAFVLTVLRPPMVYGKGCKGNFQTLRRLVERLPFFPRLHNARSMLYIDHLCAFLRHCVDGRLSGVYFPQNREYVDTCTLAAELAHKLGKPLYFSVLAGWGVRGLRLFLPLAKKAFGTLVYQDTEVFDFAYCTVDTEESIRRSL